LKIRHPHQLETAEVKERLETLIQYWSSKYGVHPRWNGSGDEAQVAGKIFGFSFEAKLRIRSSEVVVEGPPPSLLVRSRVVSYIEEKLEQVLDPSRTVSEIRSSMQPE
jgi:hypothetical protein